MNANIQELAQTLFEEAGDALFLFDPVSGRVVDVNPMAQRLSGMGRPALLEESIDTLFRSEFQGGGVRLRHACKTTASFHAQDGFLLRRMTDGGWLPVNLTVARLHARPRTLGLITVRDVSERKRSEFLLRLVWETAADGMRLTDSDGVVAMANPAYCQLVGRPAGDIVGRPLVEAYAPARRADALRHYQDLFTDRAPRKHQGVQVELWDGRRRWFEVAEAFLSSPGERPLLLSLFRDATDRKRVEEELRASEARTLAVIQTALDCIVVMDHRGHVLEFNPAAERTFGYRREETLGREMAELMVPPEHRDAHRAGLAHYLATGVGSAIGRRLELPALRKSGERFVAELSITRNPGNPPTFTGFLRDITDRTRSELALRDSEGRYRSLVESTPDGIFVNKGGRIVFANPALLRMLGAESPDLVLGKSPFDIIHPDYHPLVRERIRMILETGRTVPFVEEKYVRLDGTAVDVEIATAPFEDRGEPAFHVTLRDLTDRKRAEIALGERARLASLVGDVGIALTRGTTLREMLVMCAEALVRHLGAAFARIWTLDGSGDTLELRASAGLYTHTDGPHGRVPIGQFKIGLIAQERKPHLTNAVVGDPRVGNQEWAIREGMVAFAGYPLLVADRLVGVVALFAGHVLGDATQEALAAIADQIAVGIDRKQAEEAVRESEGRFRALIEMSFDGIVLLDRAGVVTYASPSATRILGYAREEFLGLHYSELVPAEDLREHTERHTRVVGEPGASVPSCNRYRHKDGSWRWLEVRSTNLLAEPGVRAKVVNFRDVTDQRQLEEQFRQSQKMEAFGQLAGGVAHDFNNLLTVINGYSDILLMSLPPDDPSRGPLEEIQKAGERSAGLTHQLLAFSRRQVLAPRVLNLNAVIADTEKMLRRLIGEDVALTTALEPALGPVRADSGQLEQILLNLAVNARDAMPRGGRLTIETRNVELDDGYAGSHPDAKTGPHVLLAVSDTGCGMAPEVKAKVFEPFFTTKGPGKGTGLGLATVYGIVRQSGGHVGVYTEVGIGTTFKVYLPREHAAVVATKPRSGVTVPPRGTEAVLLVEDEDGVRALTRSILSGCGYTVLEAAEGTEAMLLAERHEGPIHLLISDVVMPGPGGREVADRVAELHPGVRVLFVSGYTDDAVVRHGVLQEGMNFLQKPFSSLALAAKVREVLDAGPGPPPAGR